MRKISIYQRKNIDTLKEQAFNLYTQGLSTRKVAKEVERSHTWVWNVVRERN